jgi:hypothetical protein
MIYALLVYALILMIVALVVFVKFGNTVPMMNDGLGNAMT